jgi:MoaA/NifB/PqqE/SkfB family radical SAM enzyme
MSKKQNRYDWRYENSITYTKKYEELDNNEEKYSQWRTNTTISNYNDTIFYANEMNRASLPDKLNYDFYFYGIRKKSRFFKQDTKEERDRLRAKQQEEKDLISLISNYYKYNIVRAKEVLKILKPEHIEYIRKKQEKGES